jgi:hypothetical protein
MLVFLFSGCATKPISSGFILPDYSKCETISSILVNGKYNDTISCGAQIQFVVVRAKP